MKTRTRIAAGAGFGLVLTCLAVPSVAQDAGSSATDGHVLYGINSNTAELLRYDFDSQTLTNVGVVGGPASDAMAGIDASAHIPGHQNIYGFWTDPSDGLVKLLYIDCETAHASVLGEPLGAGVMTGATSVKTPEDGWVFPNPNGVVTELDEYAWTIFAIHEVDAQTTAAEHLHTDGTCTPVSGDINLNPNNSPHNEFTVALPGGESFTRDDLHDKDLVLPANGVFYTGAAESVWVKPKGNGNQNALSYNGESVTLENSKTYLIAGDQMQITVYNDHVHNNGRAMGHWWVRIDSGCATIEEENEQADQDLQTLLVGLYQVDHMTGQTRHLMALSRHYDALATADGEAFYATSEDKLYLINPTTQSETLIGTSELDQTMGLEVRSNMILGFENIHDKLVPFNAQNGAAMSAGMPVGMSELGTITFTDKHSDPANVAVAYD